MGDDANAMQWSCDSLHTKGKHICRRTNYARWTRFCTCFMTSPYATTIRLDRWTERIRVIVILLGICSWSNPSIENSVEVSESHWNMLTFDFRIGAKWLFGLSILIPSVLTLLVPAACRDSFPAALAIRALIGLCESASFPAIYHFLPVWIPLTEKTIM